jgi:hypothetical protein
MNANSTADAELLPESQNTPENPEVEEELEDPGTRIARLVLEDYVTTTLLRHGRPLRGSEVVAGADFKLSRAGLRAGLHNSRRIFSNGREWDLSLRAERAKWTREEKTRQPLSTALEDLLKYVGKPMGLPVMIRELAQMRSVLPTAIKDSLDGIVRDARFAIRVSDTTWLHSSYVFDPGAQREDVVRRENQIENDPDWLDLQEMPLPEPQGELKDRAVEILETVGQPLSRRLLGYMLWNQTPNAVTRENLIALFGDRVTFASLIGGYVTLQSQVPMWKGLVEDWLTEMGAGEAEVDDVALLRHRLAPNQIVAPRENELDEVRKFARSSGSVPFSVGAAIIHALELEADDPRFVGALQGLNDALRRDPAFLPLGIGRFILRESVPSHVGEVPEALRPIHLELRNSESEPLDMELTDEGLEGDGAEFIHAPQWEDISEEIEVRLPRRTGNVPEETNYILLNHHYRAGTLKLRRMDEEILGLEGGLTRLGIIAESETSRDNLSAWANRDSGLIYGLGDWLKERVPPSGGNLIFTRDGNNFRLTLGEPDALTLITPARAAELEAMREASTYLSLFEMLQTIMRENQNGWELPALWAEVNVVRRTSKRLLASVICAYHCFYFKQRGPKQQFWRFDETRVDQGFKRNKRKYVRR